MDNNDLRNISERLSMLPAMEQRKKNMQDKIYKAEDEVKSLLRKYDSEALDVEQITKDSFSNTLLKLIGKYEGKVSKENQEMLQAKLDYDRAVERVKALRLEMSELTAKLNELYTDRKTYESELLKREEQIRRRVSDQAYTTYMEIENQKQALSSQLVEINEAISAANRVTSTCNQAMDHLQSAENWATFDVWSRGGIISHLAKYEHIDDAQSQFNILNSQLRDFKNELQDVNLNLSYVSIGIDSGTRAMDFWFDNIFTDMNVRDKIRDDHEELRQIDNEVRRCLNKLESARSEIRKKLEEAENSKNKLVMEFQE